MFDMKSSDTARDIIIAPSASTLRGKLEKLDMVLVKNLELLGTNKSCKC